MSTVDHRTEDHEARHYVGASPLKLRGDAFLTGRVRFVDDIDLTGTVHAAILRSPHAHARIVSIDLERARAHPACLAAIDGDRLAAVAGPIPHRTDPRAVGGQQLDVWPLARGKAVWHGEPVAAVVAASRNDAEALLDLIAVEWEPLAPLVDVEEATAAGAAPIHAGWPDNVLTRIRYTEGDVDAALAAAPHRLGDRIDIQRYSTQPIEPRAYLADWDPRERRLTLHTTAQNPHTNRHTLAQTLRLAESQVRVIAPDIGGGFGFKMHSYPEEAVVCVLSLELGRPVKWVESRADALLIGGREHVHRWEVGFDGSGRLLALRDHFLANVGAIIATPGWGMARLTALTAPGGYKVPASDVQATVVITNKGPWNASRGYGKEATALVLEHIVDRIARHLALDPAEVRRVNFVPAHEFPYRTNSGLRLDSGEYHAALELALAASDYEGARAEQARGRAQGRLPGVGIAFEVTPEAADFPGTMTGGFDTATVKMDPSGRVTVLTGITTPGTGNDTAVAQIVADIVGVRVEEISVVQGDTDTCPFGFGNGNGRSTVMGGGSAQLAARDVAAKVRTVAAVLLETDEADVELRDGTALARASGRSLPLRDVAFAVYTLAFSTAHMVEPPLEATRVYRPGNIDHTPDAKGRIQPYTTFSYAVHVAVVDVDPETGKVELLRHLVVDDCGTLINPVAVRGQMVGAVAMGVGAALLEELTYSAAGRLLNDRFKTYLMPRSTDLPRIELEHQVTPSPFTSLGAKGAGEAGVGGAKAAIHNAVLDALSPLGAVVLRMPLTPPNVLRMIREAREEGEHHDSH